MAVIDDYSLVAIPIEMFFNSTYLGLGTAFVWAQNRRFFLITNWHNVSGKDPNTGKHVSNTAAEPNNLKVWFNQRNQLGNKVAKVIPLRDLQGTPLWFIHPNHGNSVDVIAIPLENHADVDMYAVNTTPSDDLLVQVGMDVFVLGFPFGIGPGGFPIWKRGSIASEPELSPISQLHLLVDSASRPGMSGSPVIRRSWATHLLAGQNIVTGPTTATKFVGVYSGRTASKDPLDAQLGFTWPASFVPEIVSGARIDS
jgi:Trypsin-like peptidase domain